MTSTTTYDVLIADDEPLARSSIRRLLRDDPDVRVVGEAEDGVTALGMVRKLQPTLLFLDVQMPGRTGIEMLTEIEPAYRPAVIFTTAYDEYALKAFELHAVDYLVKPYNDARFHTALERAKQRVSGRDVAALTSHVEQVIAALSRPPPPAAPASDPASQRLVVKVSGDFHFVNLADIRWIEGHGDYLKLHSTSGSPLIRSTFKELQARLDPTRFVRIHKSAMVNTDHVRRMRPALSGDYDLELNDGTQLRVSRLYKSSLDRFL
mgnify:CR=1 FL=1